MSTYYESYQEIVDPILDEVVTSESPKAYFTSIAQLPRPQVLLHAIFFTAAEVNNGGFSQLFYNSTGILAPDAKEAFDAIGMPQTALLISEAMQLFGPTYPRDWDVRREALMKMAEDFLAGPDANQDGARQFRYPDEVVSSDALLQSLSSLFYELENEENGGLEKAATRYANASFGM